jgi:hypothetical protein
MWMSACARFSLRELRLCASCSLRVGLGVARARWSMHALRCCGETRGRIVAKIIEFYIPSNFRKSEKWIPPKERGKVIEFVPDTKKTA